MTQPNTVLLTGSAGFIGSHMAQRLLKENISVIGIDSLNNYYDPNLKEQNNALLSQSEHYRFYKGSILDKPFIDNIFSSHGIDSIIHLAAYAGVRPSIENPALYYETNITGTMNILDAAVTAKVSRVLTASSSSVYGNNKKVPFSETDPVDKPISPYAASKKMGEILCYNVHHLHQLPIACLRFFTVYGPRQRPEMAIYKFTKSILEGTPIPVFNQGNCLRDYTHIDDIVQGMYKILTSSNLSYDIINLGESATISTLDLIQLIEKECEKKAKLNLLPSQTGDVDRTYADITHAKSTYNYTPKTPIQDGIKSFVNWYKTTHPH